MTKQDSMRKMLRMGMVAIWLYTLQRMQVQPLFCEAEFSKNEKTKNKKEIIKAFFVKRGMD